MVDSSFVTRTRIVRTLAPPHDHRFKSRDKGIAFGDDSSMDWKGILLLAGWVWSPDVGSGPRALSPMRSEGPVKADNFRACCNECHPVDCITVSIPIPSCLVRLMPFF